MGTISVVVAIVVVYTLDIRCKGEQLMPSMQKNNLIKELRMRKRFTQQMLLSESSYETAISRLEHNYHDPNSDTLSTYLESMDMPVDSYFSPFLENVSSDAYTVRDQIRYHLDYASESALDLARGKALLKKLKGFRTSCTVQKPKAMGNFTKGRNLQLIISFQVCIDEIEGREPEKIASKALKGIKLTYPEFKEHTFKGEVLLFEEPELIHMFFKAIGKNDTKRAIAGLQRMKKSIERLHRDAKDKEKILPKVLLSLADLLMLTGEYAQVVDVCEQGKELSIKRTSGWHAPDFEYKKALALVAQGLDREAEKLIMPMYCGFVMMQRAQMVQAVKDLASKVGVELNTYAIEDLPKYEMEINFEHGLSIPAKSIGDLLYGLRDDAGLKQKELCRGICGTSIYSRIEKDEVQGKVYYLEAFMQRLGRDINKYFYTFLGWDEFEGKQLRDEIRSLSANRNYGEAMEKLETLKKHKDYVKGVNKQFLMWQEAFLKRMLQGQDEEYLVRLKEAWAVTKDDFDSYEPYDLARVRLTNYEIVIANLIALYLCENGDRPKGIRMYEYLLANLEKYYVDESERMRAYINLLCNFANNLEFIKRDAEAHERAIQGIKLCLKHRELRYIPFFWGCICSSLFNDGDKDKSLTYAVASYYGTCLLDDESDINAMRQYIKDKFSIELN